MDANAGCTDPVSGLAMKKLIKTIRNFGLSFHVWKCEKDKLGFVLRGMIGKSLWLSYHSTCI